MDVIDTNHRQIHRFFTHTHAKKLTQTNSDGRNGRREAAAKSRVRVASRRGGSPDRGPRFWASLPFRIKNGDKTRTRRIDIGIGKFGNAGSGNERWIACDSGAHDRNRRL